MYKKDIMPTSEEILMGGRGSGQQAVSKGKVRYMIECHQKLSREKMKQPNCAEYEEMRGQKWRMECSEKAEILKARESTH